MLHLSRRTVLIALVSALPLAAAAADADAPVTLEAARSAHEAGRALLVDVREPAEHATGVAAGAKLLPLQQLGARMAEIPRDPARPVLLICNTQNRSRVALKALRERGWTNVQFVEGGMSEWVRRGFPVVAPGR